MNVLFYMYTDGYPSKFSAANTKFEFLSKGLIKNGVEVSCINKIYGCNNIGQAKSIYKGVNCFSIGNERTKLNSIISNLFKSLLIIKKQYNTKASNFLFFGCGNVFILIPAIIFSKIIGYKIIFIFEEWLPSMPFKGFYKINAFIHGHLMGYFSDYIMPISEYLKNKSLKFKKPIYKLPICANFECISESKINKFSNYFLYCASASYQRAIDFILDSFGKFSLDFGEKFSLHLVIKGSDEQINRVKLMCKKYDVNNKVVIYSDLKYSDLILQYKNAIALLIPLFPDSITDIARFSQKISEYLSSQRPIISSAVGEIPVYFHNNEDMYIDNTFSSDGFAKIMKHIAFAPDEATDIGISGYNKGKSLFHYEVIVDNMIKFLKNQ